MTGFYLDSLDSLQLRQSQNYEKDVRQVFEDCINLGDIVVDAGAHIGWHAVLLSQLVGEDGQVFAFEPEPENFALLKKNCRIGGFDNVVLENKAVSNQNGNVNLYISEENSGDHRIYASDFTRESITVESVRLDDYFGPKEVDFVKMDIQGAEVEALAGMKSLLDYKHLKLCMEFWPYGIRRSGFEPDDLVNMLVDYKFRMFDIPNEHPVNLESLLTVYDRGKPYFTDIFCTRQKVMLRWLMK